MNNSAKFAIICAVGVFFTIAAVNYIPIKPMSPSRPITGESRQNSESLVSNGREVIVATTSHSSENLSEIRPHIIDEVTKVGIDVARIEMIQRQRQERLREGCEHLFNHSAQVDDIASELHRTVFRFTVYNAMHHVMMCMMPKIGTTTWRRNVFLPLDPNFHQLSRTRQARFNGDPHHYHYTTLSQISARNPSALKSMFQDYFSFVFVREPLERLLSAFLSKLGRPLNRADKPQFLPTAENIYRRMHPKMFAGLSKAKSNEILKRITVFNISFPDFVRAWLTQDEDMYNRHWGQYTRVCRPCEIPFKYIGHYETLGDDSEYIINHATDLHEFVSFPDVYPSASRARLYEMYSRVPVDDIIALGEVYKDEYALFGYSFQDIFDELMEHRNETVSA